MTLESNIVPLTPKAGLQTSEGAVTALTATLGGLLDLAVAMSWIAPLDPTMRGAVVIAITGVVGAVVGLYQRQRTQLKVAHVQARAAVRSEVKAA